MISANIAELRRNLSQLLERVAAGEEIEVRKRNVPVARLVPIAAPRPNETKLGCGRGTAVVHGDLTTPVWSEGDWGMLQA